MEIDAFVEPSLVEDCYRLLYKGNSKKMILQLNHRKGLWNFSIQQKQLKDFDTKTVTVHSGPNTYIYKSLCINYENLWPNSTGLWFA